MKRTNVEIKAKCVNPDAARAWLGSRKARVVGEDHQIDTYFRVKHGRLKLREGRIENALIHYQRSDTDGPRQSDVLLYHAPPDPALKAILEQACGVLVVVDKRRSIRFIDNVKFHVDDVQGLGTFVEIEAIDEDGTISVERLQQQCEYYMKELGIQDEDLISCSYSDLLLKRTSPGPSTD